MRRVDDSDVRLLASLPPQGKPGELLAAARGDVDGPHDVCRAYGPVARESSFAPTA